MKNYARGSRLPQWLGDAASYEAAHSRLRRSRGSASSHPCAACSRPAHHWAYDHCDANEKTAPNGLAFSTDPSHYRPMCARCHTAFDTEATGRAAKCRHCSDGGVMTTKKHPGPAAYLSGTGYMHDALIGTEADVSERPDEQAAVVRLLSACGAGDLAECLGLTA